MEEVTNLTFVLLPDEQYNTPMGRANEKQVGGSHYKTGKLEHWDIVAQHNLDYFQGQITKYVMRWRSKNGVEDLEKAAHFLEKYIEVERAKQEAEDGSEPGPSYVNQDGRSVEVSRPTLDRTSRPR